MDTKRVADATGWRIVHLASTASTNDAAAHERRAGAGARTAVVADEQTAGRGRERRTFASPRGGLYVSLLLDVAPEHRPGPLVAVCAVAASEAIESLGGVRAAIKWPNDVWLQRRKVAGILVEAASQESLVVAGIGINVAGVPEALDPDVARRTTSVFSATGRSISPAVLLEALLRRVDHWIGVLATGTETLEAEWSDRLALVGERVAFTYAGERRVGVLESASLVDGLLVRDPVAGPVWREGAFLQDLTPSEP